MNKEADKPNPNPLEHLLRLSKSFLEKQVDSFNRRFNKLSLQIRRTSLIVCGISMACVCAALILQAIYGQASGRISVDQITLPNDMYMSKPNTQRLTPIGKMKGEMNGEFEAFHVAIDGEGQLFINRNPEFSKDSLYKSKGWESITRQRLEVYEKKLHFIPSRKNGLKR